MKINMFGPLRNLLRRLVEPASENRAAPSTATASTRPIVMGPRPVTGSPHNNGAHHNGRAIELPLQPILSGLPLELQPRLRQPDAGELTICVPLEKILAQLSRGAVQISFGELRQAAPDLFTPEDDRDRVLVSLPLGEILTRLNPALITRRRVQKQVEIPAEISSPFDQHNRSQIFSVGPTKPDSTPTPAAAPASRQTAIPAPAPVVSTARSGLTFAPTPPPPAAAPLAAPAMSSSTRALRDLNSRKPSAPPPAPAAPAPAPAKPSAEADPLLVSLISLAESWPEAVRHELVQLNLVEARVALPVEVVERALKQGRIAFTWKTLRSWIKPAPLPVVSAHDNSVLELPLKIVAPPFLARQKEHTKFQKKVSVDDEIPNLFFGFPRAEAASATVASATSPAAATTADTNFYVWDDSSDNVKAQENELKPAASPGTKFVAKYATPNEVVSRAAALEGVAGVLIALPDGLMVASRLSPDLNGDTLAAFLPQIFGKVNQCTKELRMGDLNNVNFTVGNIPWKIFRVNAIFFAAFGRAGEPLPTAQLAAFAAELDHKPK
jgi:predicted regulator of Ras-like GTPase activity (Roadblock/LC7/MglB family)